MINTVVGNYKITAKIGEGGMGAVYKGIDLMLEREVAIKALKPELSVQPQVVERFRSEAMMLAKLNHPNIGALYSFFRQGEEFFMVMEFMHGQTLDRLIGDGRPMSPDEAVPLFYHALEGIGYAHRMGIIHRDIKPANMMLTADGLLKVLDFGIARVLGTARLTRAGNLIGTIEYMSPEQVRGHETDARSDIYSLGILLYEMLTGRVPFTGDNEYALMKMQVEDTPIAPREYASAIPESVECAILRAIAKDPADRFQTALEFRQALAGTVDGAVTGPERHIPSYFNAATSSASIPPGGLTASAPAATDPAAKHLAKETRLAESDPPVAQPTNNNAQQIKSTRLARPAGANDHQAHYPAYSTTPDSLPGKLNWKVYAGVAAAVVVLGGCALLASVFLIAGGAGKQTSNANQASIITPAPASNSTSPQESSSNTATTPTTNDEPVFKPGGNTNSNPTSALVVDKPLLGASPVGTDENASSPDPTAKKKSPAQDASAPKRSSPPKSATNKQRQINELMKIN